MLYYIETHCPKCMAVVRPVVSVVEMIGQGSPQACEVIGQGQGEYEGCPETVVEEA